MYDRYIYIYGRGLPVVVISLVLVATLGPLTRGPSYLSLLRGILDWLLISLVIPPRWVSSVALGFRYGGLVARPTSTFFWLRRTLLPFPEFWYRTEAQSSQLG